MLYKNNYRPNYNNNSLYTGIKINYFTPANGNINIIMSVYS